MSIWKWRTLEPWENEPEVGNTELLEKFYLETSLKLHTTHKEDKDLWDDWTMLRAALYGRGYTDEQFDELQNVLVEKINSL